MRRLKKADRDVDFFFIHDLVETRFLVVCGT
jgi:hypothetical protein